MFDDEESQRRNVGSLVREAVVDFWGAKVTLEICATVATKIGFATHQNAIPVMILEKVMVAHRLFLVA